MPVTQTSYGAPEEPRAYSRYDSSYTPAEGMYAPRAEGGYGPQDGEPEIPSFVNSGMNRGPAPQRVSPFQGMPPQQNPVREQPPEEAQQETSSRSYLSDVPAYLRRQPKK